MPLLEVPQDLGAILARPGREWTPPERRRVVVWLNERCQRRSLLRLCFCAIRTEFKAVAGCDAEDAWESFCADRLEYLIAVFDPARGPFEPFLRMLVTQHARKAGKILCRQAERQAGDAQAGIRLARGADPEQALLRGERVRRLRATVNTLPAGERAVIVWHYFRNATLKELASVLGISVDNAKVRLHRARLRLRTRLGPEGL